MELSSKQREQIRQLSVLYQHGAISLEEFERGKRAISNGEDPKLFQGSKKKVNIRRPTVMVNRHALFGDPAELPDDPDESDDSGSSKTSSGCFQNARAWAAQLVDDMHFVLRECMKNRRSILWTAIALLFLAVLIGYLRGA